MAKPKTFQVTLELRGTAIYGPTGRDRYDRQRLGKASISRFFKSLPDAELYDEDVELYVLDIKETKNG